MHILGGEKEEVLHKTVIYLSFHLSYRSKQCAFCSTIFNAL